MAGDDATATMQMARAGGARATPVAGGSIGAAQRAEPPAQNTPDRVIDDIGALVSAAGLG